MKRDLPKKTENSRIGGESLRRGKGHRRAKVTFRYFADNASFKEKGEGTRPSLKKGGKERSHESSSKIDSCLRGEGEKVPWCRQRGRQETREAFHLPKGDIFERRGEVKGKRREKERQTFPLG